MKFFITFVFSILITYVGFAQTNISGTIKDETSLQPIPYVSIGVVGKAYGTLSDKNGYFSFTLPALEDADTIKISAIGYKTLTLTTYQIENKKEPAVYLTPIIYDLTEVKIKPKKLLHKTLGTSKYSTTNCTAFMGKDANWKGEQAAIRANNEEGLTVYLESFGFYIIKNDYTDSLTFRLMLYDVDAKGYPGKTFLKRPIIFTTAVKNGEVTVNLKPYEISTTGDFFISLECLEEEMESSKFCFAGSIKVPSYFKTSAFSRWGKVKGGGADLNIKVSYKK